MTSPELRKRTAYFLIFVGLMVLGLFLISSVLDESVRVYFQPWVDFQIEGGPRVRDPKDQMIQTSFELITSAIRILKILLCMAIVVASVRFISHVITAYRKSGSASEISTLLRTVLSVVIYIVGFFIIFSHYFPSVQLAPLFTGSTILGIVVGLALQDTLGNLFAGLALQADQPFQIGDVIAITGKGTGVIESVSWRGVKIRTFQNKVLIISNSVIGKEAFEVAPKGNLNARAVFFSTVYSASPARTVQIVRDTVRSAENVSPRMRPVVRIRGLAESGIEWEIKYWLEDYTKYNDTDALIRERVWYALNREHINFSHPELNVHVVEKPFEIPAEERFNAIADRLNQVSIFAPLDDEEIERLANASTSRVYAPDEAIVRLGQEGNSMFVIIRGSVKVQIPERDHIKTINTLRENDFFGEMSLLTGEPRSASVIAMEESEVLRIDKNGLKPILESNPTLVQSISELVEERRQLLVKLSEMAEEEEERIAAKKGMMGSIRKFFGLRKGGSS